MPKIKREFVTPDIARGWLRSNAENQRPKKEGKIPGYARDMITGNWDEGTTETIKFAEDGALIDGQNRLAAVVMAGDQLPEGGIYFDVAYGLKRDTMLVIDSGSTRSAADALKITSVVDRNNVSAIVRWAIQADAGNWLQASSGIQPTHKEIMDRFRAEPEAFAGASKRASDFRRQKLGNQRALGMAHYLFTRIDADQGHAFADSLLTGANLAEKDPILVLRNRLVRAYAERLKPREQLILCIRAWNYYRAGETTSALLVSTGRSPLTNANFPKPR